MALIVETGLVVAGAESYASVAAADTRHSNFGNTAWALLTTARKEQCLRLSTLYMLQRYRPQWKGYRNDASQTLDWPRSFVYKEPYVLGASGSYPYLVADNIVPDEVVSVCIDLALKADTTTLMPDTTQQITREKVDKIEISYSEFSPQATQYVAFDALLSPYLKYSGVSVNLYK